MSSTSPGAQREPMHPRERRDAGHRRARQVTVWSAAGGTALSVVFGVMLAGSTPRAAAGAPDPDAPRVAPSTTHHRKLSPPVQAPQIAAPSPKRHHASSGAS